MRIELVVGLVMVLSSARRSQEVSFRFEPLKKDQKISVVSTLEGTTPISMKRDGTELQKMNMPSEERINCAVVVTTEDKKGPSAASFALKGCRRMWPSAFGLLRNQSQFSWSSTATRGNDGKAIVAIDTDAGDGSKKPSDAELELRTLKTETAGWIWDSVVSSPLATVLDGKTLKVGDEVKVPADIAQKTIAPCASRATVKSMTLTFESRRNEAGLDVAVFKVASIASAPATKEGTGDVTIKIAGEIGVTTSGMFVVTGALTGDLVLHGTLYDGSNPIAMEGTGSIKWTYSAKVE